MLSDLVAEVLENADFLLRRDVLEHLLDHVVGQVTLLWNTEEKGLSSGSGMGPDMLGSDPRPTSSMLSTAWKISRLLSFILLSKMVQFCALSKPKR